MTKRPETPPRVTAILAALLALGGPAAAQTFTSTTPTMTTVNPPYKLYGTDSRFDRVEGDITTTPTAPTLSNGIENVRGTLTITGGSYDDVASVSLTDAGLVATRGRFRETFTPGLVRRIVFYGNDGADTFVNSTSIQSAAFGGAGNDILDGGSGVDFLVGGLGNDALDGNGGDDVMWGSGGHDDLDGGSGDDYIKGHGGDDFLFGGSGNDAIYGGSGEDEISGSSGVDTLVSIGGGIDDVIGGTSDDFFWVDTVDDVIDATSTEKAGGYVNDVAAFYSYTYNVGITSIPVPKDLTDFDLDDPISEDTTDTLVNFGNHPLFSELGPLRDDVKQGGAEDCFILGPLAAVAAQTPDSIRKLVVDLDDGTYAVRFYRQPYLQPEYVRVDADLYVKGDGELHYAHFGPSNALWPLIVEKAFAWYRNRDGTYASASWGANGADGKTIMHGSSESFTIPAVFDASDVQAWIASGRPSGGVKNYIDSTVPQLLMWINDRLEEGRPVYTGYIGDETDDTTPLDGDNWRRGQHIIMIDRVLFDANGEPIGIVLYDQYVDRGERSYLDFAHIYHLLGRASTYDMP